MSTATATPPPGTARSLAAVGVALVGVAACGWLATDGDWSQSNAVAVALVALLSAIAAWDARTMRAPNLLVLPAVVVGLGLLATLGGREFVQGLAGGTAAFAALLLLAFFGRGALGYGDVKTGAVCGMAVGLSGVFTWLLASFLLGGVVALIVLITGFRGRKDSIALTPFLAAGVVVTTVVFGTYLVP